MTDLDASRWPPKGSMAREWVHLWLRSRRLYRVVWRDIEPWLGRWLALLVRTGKRVGL